MIRTFRVRLADVARGDHDTNGCFAQVTKKSPSAKSLPHERFGDLAIGGFAARRAPAPRRSEVFVTCESE
jgi:hypothetical protein